MSATIIVEDGTGANIAANSYLSLVDADAYFQAAVINSEWIAATTDLKNRLLITATKILDDCCDFFGFKANANQPLQWPRILSRDPNAYGGAFYQRPDTYLAQYWDATKVPAGIKDAVCEMARYLLTAINAGEDRSADAPGKGIEEFEIYQGIKVKFSKGDQRPIIPDALMFKLQNYGTVRGGNGGNVRVTRT